LALPISATAETGEDEEHSGDEEAGGEDGSELGARRARTEAGGARPGRSLLNDERPHRSKVRGRETRALAVLCGGDAVAVAVL
jgi:hypothetical protein